MGCKSTQQKLQESITQAFQEDPTAGNVLCGYPVPGGGLTNVSVSAVTHSGSDRAGTGSANVTGTPMAIPGMPAPAPCSGTVSYTYDTSSSTTGYGRRRRTTTTFHVWNIRMTSRAGVPVTSMAGMGTPGMPGVPGMPSGRTAAMPGMASMTTVGMIQTGNLQMGDTPLTDGSVADDYNVMLTAGMPVTIVVRGGPSVTSPGSNLDVYTILLQNGVEVTHDDDSAGNLNSRIIFTPPTTGMYTVRITTYGSGLRQGMYTLQTYPGANPMAM